MEPVFEPALGLGAVEGVALAGGGVAALAEGFYEFAELGLGLGGEGGFVGGVAEGDLLDAVEVFCRGTLADAGELEAVDKEGELCGGADALGDDGAEGLRNERHDLGGGGGEALAGGLRGWARGGGRCGGCRGRLGRGG